MLLGDALKKSGLIDDSTLEKIKKENLTEEKATEARKQAQEKSKREGARIRRDREQQEMVNQIVANGNQLMIDAAAKITEDQIKLFAAGVSVGLNNHVDPADSFSTRAIRGKIIGVMGAEAREMTTEEVEDLIPVYMFKLTQVMHSTDNPVLALLVAGILGSK